MYYKNEKKHTGLKVVLTIISLLLVLMVAGAAFLLLGGLDMLEMLGEAPLPYLAQGQVRALELKAPEGETTEAGLRKYFGDAADFALLNGFNTLVFEGKQDLTVYWRDSIFPVSDALAAKDTLFDKVDPLALLCEEAASRNVQVWLQADPYAAGGFTPEMKGKAAARAAKLDKEQVYFSAGDATYTELLVKSLSRLPHKYPVAGIVLTGLHTGEGNPVGDADAWRVAFGNMAREVRAVWSEKGYVTSLSLRFGLDEASLVDAPLTAALAEEGIVDTLLPKISTGKGLAATLQQWGAQGAGLVVIQPEDDSAGVLLFTAAGTPGFSGALLGSWPAVAEEANTLALLASALTPAEGTLPTGFDIPRSLSINYPAEGAKISTEGLFIMGTSDPAQPLYMDGEEITVRGKNGAFGIAVTLAPGANAFAFTQESAAVTLNVEKPVPVAGGGSGGVPAEMGNDSTQEAPEGQAVRVSTVIASALSDYGDDSTMNETLHQGAVFLVHGNVQTVRWDAGRGANVKTWAYKLASGDYVLARNCTWVSGAEGASAFTGLTAEADESGEWLNFEGSGTPAAYQTYDNEGGTLSLTFYDTSLTLPEGFTSQLVQSARLEAEGEGVVLKLQTSNSWGYSLEYAEGRMRLFLKRAPVLSGDAAKPLAGVRVLLDPGHGDADIGAPGLMGPNGPNEKDLNFALAQTIAYRLRQLGAEVSMTREGDSFPTLDDRLGAQTAQKPDFFIAVHHNSAELTQDLNSVSGAQAYYYHPYDIPASKAFAQNLLNEVSQATGRSGGEARWGYYYVTRTTVCPSVLFEYGFVINPLEFEDISSKDGLYAAACATAEGLMRTIPAAG